MEDEREARTMARDMLGNTQVVDISDEARAMVLEARASEDDAERLALWLEVSGVGPAGFTYDLYFQSESDAAGEDSRTDVGGLTLVVPEASIDRLRGATLDVSGAGEEAGMVVRNPNTPAPPAPTLPPGVEADLTSDLARRVLDVLEGDVNPSIAAHGGRADLVGVADGVAYLQLSGGCQGCGLARVTLSQGIEVAITEAVPEIVSVADVTDHASGTDPYFESAKK